MLNFTQDGWLIRTSLTTAYSILFVVGELGNVTVIVTVSMLFCQSRNLLYKASHNTLIYVITLSLVDALALSTLPFTAVSYVYKEWLFGSAFCKAYFTLEALNKILSPLLLTALAFDRFVNVSFPSSRFIHCREFTSLLIGILVLISLTVMAPAVHHAGLHPNVCSANLPVDYIAAWVSVLFAVGYCAPGTLIIIFYLALIHTLGQQQISRQRRHVKVAKMSSVLIGFYFLCYTPYWFVAVLCPAFSPFPPTPTLVMVQSILHLLPYINSSANPILYALMNTEIRRKTREMRTYKRVAALRLPLLAIRAAVPFYAAAAGTRRPTITSDGGSIDIVNTQFGVENWNNLIRLNTKTWVSEPRIDVAMQRTL